MKTLKKYRKIIAGLAFAGILAALYIWFFVYNKPHPDYEHLEAKSHHQSEALFEAYRSNPTSSNENFTGQMISINGKIDHIEHTEEQTIVIFVFDEGMFGDQGIRCSLLENYKQTATSLQPGTKVKIKGFCTGYNDTDVILEKCTVNTI